MTFTGASGKCGSTYIDRNLHTLLSKRFGRSFDDLSFAQRGPGSKFMISFEKNKRDFGLIDDRDTREIGPIRLEVPDSEHYDEERMVKLTYKDMRTLFDPVVSEITNLVSQQVWGAKTKKNATIDRVILVGGFAESPYLMNTLKDWCWQNGNIGLICPEYPQSAVVRGAALRGLEGIAPRIKYARRHYGVALGMPFREGIDLEENAYFDSLDNTKRCRHRLKWLISKGDEVVSGTFGVVNCMREYCPGRENVFEDELYSSSLVDAPEYSTHPRVHTIGVIKSTFGADFNYGPRTECRFNPKLGRVVHRFSHDIKVVFGAKGSNLTFQIIAHGKVVSMADIEFDQR